MLGGLLAAGGFAAHSGEAIAKPTAEKLELREEKANKDIVWAMEAETQFNAAYDAQDSEVMADVVRAFIREYRFPTEGPIRMTSQNNPMRVLDRGEWGRVREVALGFLAKSATWGPDHKALEINLADAIAGMDRHIDDPGPAHGQSIPVGRSGNIKRSLGY
ncbi:MAG: hypothetical protein AAB663_03440 [Patescibacteria group bacterium]